MSSPASDLDLLTPEELRHELAQLRRQQAAMLDEQKSSQKELEESLEYQAATASVLRAIARSPGTLQPVLDEIVETASRLCEAEYAIYFNVVGDHCLAAASNNIEHLQYLIEDPTPLMRGAVTARAALSGEPVHVPDVLADPEYTRIGSQHAAQHRCCLSVPLIKNGQAIGVISMLRREPRPFNDKQIALMETFADQALIAIENARLFEAEQARTMEVEVKSAELAETLEYQTAISDILGIISTSPNSVKPVFDRIVETAARLCHADRAIMRNRRGETYPICAHYGLTERQYQNFLSYPDVPTPGNLWGGAILESRTIHNADTIATPVPERPNAANELGVGTGLCVPLMLAGQAIGTLTVTRQQVKAFDPRQIELLETFADQAVIAIENARLIEAERSRTKELQQSLEYQAASGEVLNIISRSPTNVRPVFDAIVESAAKLCESDVSVVHLCAGDKLHPAAAWNWTTAARAHLDSELTRLDRSHLSGRAILERKTVHVSDVLEDPEYSHPLALDGSWRAVLAVPMLRDGNPLGAIAIAKTKPTAFTDSQVSLLENFADQAVIAIENARLFEELQESLEYQTATSEVLSVISQSRSQVTPVLEAIVETATRLCHADHASVFRVRNGSCHLESSRAAPEFVRYVRDNPLPLDGKTQTARAARELRVIHVPDTRTSNEIDQELIAHSKSRTLLSVPLLRENTCIGVISIGRRSVSPFSIKQIELVTTFADQAVIAIENARLFETERLRTQELQESLEYQSATSAVLSVISQSPNKLQPVLDEIAGTAHRLLEAVDAIILLKDGADLRIAAHSGEMEIDFDRAPIDRGWVSGRAVIDRKTVHVHDLQSASNEFPRGRAIAGRLGQRTVLAVPLIREDAAIGVLFLRRADVVPFTDNQIALLETFSDQAVIAINNVALFEEVQARSRDLARTVEELKSLGEVGRVVSSTLDMGQVLQTILANAVRMADAGGGAIYVYKPETKDFHLSANLNMHDELMGRVRAQPLGLSDPVVGDCARQRQAVQIEDLTQEDVRRSPLLDLLFRAGVRSIMAVPLLRHDEVVGALVIRRGHAGSFGTETVNLLETFAAQSAIAVNNARLFEEVARKSVELEIASKHKSQFVANMSHELRTPLAAMLGYTELLVDGLFGELPAKAVTTLERIQSNGKHLLGLINAVLDISKIEAGQFSLNLGEYAVSNLVETVRVATESLASAKGIGFNTDVAPELPHGFGDEPRLTQVLLNLVGNAIKFTDKGEVKVIARVEDDAFAIAVRDTGPGIPPAEQARIFEEFHQVDSSDTRVKGGTGLGLAIARRIVEMHGGRIWVESQLGAGATIHIRLPVRTTAQGAAA